MSKFLTLIQKKSRKQRFDNKPIFWYKFLFSTRVLNIVVAAAICFVGILYLGQINSMAIKGFKIKELEEKQTALKENIRKTEFQVAELQSVQKIQERINNLGMVSVARVEYASSGGVVAVK